MTFAENWAENQHGKRALKSVRALQAAGYQVTPIATPLGFDGYVISNEGESFTVGWRVMASANGNVATVRNGRIE